MVAVKKALKRPLKSTDTSHLHFGATLQPHTYSTRLLDPVLTRERCDPPGVPAVGAPGQSAAAVLRRVRTDRRSAERRPPGRYDRSIRLVRIRSLVCPLFAPAADGRAQRLPEVLDQRIKVHVLDRRLDAVAAVVACAPAGLPKTQPVGRAVAGSLEP